MSAAKALKRGLHPCAPVHFCATTRVPHAAHHPRCGGGITIANGLIEHHRAHLLTMTGSCGRPSSAGAPCCSTEKWRAGGRCSRLGRQGRGFEGIQRTASTSGVASILCTTTRGALQPICFSPRRAKVSPDAGVSHLSPAYPSNARRNGEIGFPNTPGGELRAHKSCTGKMHSTI